MPCVRRWSLLLVLGLLASLGLGGTPAAAPPQAEPDRRGWRREFQVFLELPLATQERIRQLDRQLQDLDAETQAHFYQVMQRYCEWLDRLPPARRQWIEDAGSVSERLERIRQVREDQWIASLPKADRDQLAAAKKKSPADYRQLVATIRERELERELLWHLAMTAEDEQEQLKTEMNRWQAEVQSKLTKPEHQTLKDAKAGEKQQLFLQYALQYGVPMPPLLREVRLRRQTEAFWNQRLLDFLKYQLSPSERSYFENRLKERPQQAREELHKLYQQRRPEDFRRFRPAEMKPKLAPDSNSRD